MVPVRLTQFQVIGGFGKVWMSVRDCGASVACSDFFINWRTGEQRFASWRANLDDPLLRPRTPRPDRRYHGYRLRFRGLKPLVLTEPSGRRLVLDKCADCRLAELTHGMAVWVNGGVVRTILLGTRRRASYRLARDRAPGNGEIGLIASVTKTHLIADAPGDASQAEHPLWAASLRALRRALR
jgi:hypothetical protein